MCSINHDLKCVYIHTPKCGGTYIANILERFYNFKTYYFTSENHKYYIDEKILTKKNYSINYGFLLIKKYLYQYFRNSEKFNLISGMDEKKWKEYFKFTFKRHPLDKFISAYKYLEYNPDNINFIDILENKNISIKNFDYFHISITLTDLLISKNNDFEFDYIGEYENLNAELIYILGSKLNIKEIKHKYYIINDILLNSSEKKKKN